MSKWGSLVKILRLIGALANRLDQGDDASRQPSADPPPPRRRPRPAKPRGSTTGE
jgi:hypothetical protein